MRRRGAKKLSGAEEVRDWFAREVSFEGEPYIVDLEQAEAICDTHKNTIVVARAGSGKTRTIVAKVVYLIARLGVKPEEIIAFVFNANAAAEINERLSKMMIRGEPAVARGTKIAWTFHAFSRHLVYEVCNGGEKCGKILAGEKDLFVTEVVRKMARDPFYYEYMVEFVYGRQERSADESSVNRGGEATLERRLTEGDILYLSRMMAQFINRAGQKYLGGEARLRENVEKRMEEEGVTGREKVFLALGLKCFQLYHWYLLNPEARERLPRWAHGYGTDFNLIVSWASKIIAGRPKKGDNLRKNARRLVRGLKYVLVDEYQDFSQLFLGVIEAMREVQPEVRLFVVGDDLQAINRFAGSDVSYFKEFEKYFPEDARRLGISTNYRCNYMIVTTARRFMKKAMRDKGEFHAFSRGAGDVMVADPVGYDGEYLDLVARLILENREAREILILHRNNETNIEGLSLDKIRWRLRRKVAKELPRAEFEKRVKIMTMHKSKGLEAEVVIILEADTGVIPRSHPDTRLYTVFGETEEAALDDQKRLFYVAMTRAKKKLYIIHREAADKGFLKFLGRGVDRWGEE